LVRRLLGTAAIVSVLGAAGFLVLTVPQVVSGAGLGPYQPNIANGQTMFQVGGCSSCHAVPEQPDRTRLGGGLALKSPFGTFYVPNISSDRTDGIGAWSEPQFITALTRGTSPQDYHYYPALPYTSYELMSADDLRDLFAFLKTLPAVPGKIRDHDLPFPFNIRRPLGLWKLLFLKQQPFKPDPTKSSMWNRGAYLVNGPGHCAECHSARNFLGAVIESQRFAGAPNPDGKGWVPNITQARLKDWSEQDIAFFLETGLTPDGDSAGSSMREVVRNLAQLPGEDRQAIATYVKALAPVLGPKRPDHP
jgi:mono/diheme cytochrome c family protein